MNSYFDPAIIIKLYVYEATSPDALRLANECPVPYLLSPWQEIETRTALRPKGFWKEITHTEMQASLTAFAEDILTGRWKTPEYKEATVWRFARELSDRQAGTVGCRTLDLIHVAVALSLGVALDSNTPRAGRDLDPVHIPVLSRDLGMFAFD